MIFPAGVNYSEVEVKLRLNQSPLSLLIKENIHSEPTLDCSEQTLKLESETQYYAHTTSQ